MMMTFLLFYLLNYLFIYFIIIIIIIHAPTLKLSSHLKIQSFF
jgi:hypothetical protein